MQRVQQGFTARSGASPKRAALLLVALAFGLETAAGSAVKTVTATPVEGSGKVTITDSHILDSQAGGAIVKKAEPADTKIRVKVHTDVRFASGGKNRATRTYNYVPTPFAGMPDTQKSEGDAEAGSKPSTAAEDYFQSLKHPDAKAGSKPSTGAEDYYQRLLKQKSPGRSLNKATSTQRKSQGRSAGDAATMVSDEVKDVVQQEVSEEVKDAVQEEVGEEVKDAVQQEVKDDVQQVQSVTVAPAPSRHARLRDHLKGLMDSVDAYEPKTKGSKRDTRRV